MTVSLKVASFPLLVAMTLASGSVLADGLLQKLSRERVFADTPSQQFYNFEHNDRLRHRVNPPLYSHQEQANHQNRKQHGNQAKHQYRYREQSGGPHRHQSGSMSRGSGGGSQGGGRGR